MCIARRSTCANRSTRWRSWSLPAWAWTRCRGRCSCSSAGAETKQHSTYRSKYVVIEYRWHPLHGRRVLLFRRSGRRGYEVVHIEAAVGLSRELPAWMVDAAVCAAMSLGPPQLSVAALIELRALLLALSSNSSVLPNSCNSEGKSDEAAGTSIPTATPATPRAREPTSTSRERPRGTGERAGRSSAGSARRGDGETDRRAGRTAV